MAGVVLAGASVAWSATDADLSAQVQVLQQRVAELEAKQTDQAIQEKNAELIRQLVTEMAANQKNAAADTGVTAGYDKRFFIKSADDQFKLEFDTLMQFRHSYLLSDDGAKTQQKDGTRFIYDADLDDYVYTEDGVDSSASGFEFERARLSMSGHVLKDLKYRIVLEGDDDSSSKGIYLYEYELNYSFIPELGARVGKYKIPFGKQEPGSSGKLMFVDRSLANNVFNLDRSEGVEVFGTIDLGEIKPEYRAMLFNGFRSNEDTPYADNDNSPAAVARLAVPLMGSSVADFDGESDLEFHENPIAMIGMSYAYANDRDEDHFSGGDSDNYKFLGKSAWDRRGDVYTLGGEANMISADASFKYMGFSMTHEGYYQHITADPAEMADASDFGNMVRSGMIGQQVDNYGWYSQAGYFIVPKVFEVVSRVGGVFVDNATDSYEYAGGWNWYLSGQDLKLSMDITYIDDLPVANTSSNFDGVQNNALFMIRSQLQFQF